MVVCYEYLVRYWVCFKQIQSFLELSGSKFMLVSVFVHCTVVFYECSVVIACGGLLRQNLSDLNSSMKIVCESARIRP